MSLDDYKITDNSISTNGVVAAPDKLTGTAEQNKMIFDRLIRETVKAMFNGLIDALSSEYGAGEIGTDEIEGLTGADVQTILGSLKTLVDTKAASADMTAALALKSDKSVTDLHFKSVSLNAETGVFTFTREDGSFVTVDTVLEKVATNWQYDSTTQSLVLTLADGTTQSVPLSAFITETEFEDSAQLAFSVSNHKVTATVKAGSITDTMLSSALIAQLRGCVTSASDSATDAAQSANAAESYKNAAASSASTATSKASEASQSAAAAAGSATTAATQASSAESSAVVATTKASEATAKATLAESWAVGGTNTRTGEDTNNAKYWSDRASAIVGGDYTTREELAGKEATSTASKAYAVGDYLTYNGAIYRVTAAIVQGDALTAGTNITVAKLGDDLSKKIGVAESNDDFYTIYVNTDTGNDNNDGKTSGTPVLTLGKAILLIPPVSNKPIRINIKGSAALADNKDVHIDRDPIIYRSEAARYVDEDYAEFPKITIYGGGRSTKHTLSVGLRLQNTSVRVENLICREISVRQSTLLVSNCELTSYGIYAYLSTVLVESCAFSINSEAIIADGASNVSAASLTGTCSTAFRAGAKIAGVQFPPGIINAANCSGLVATGDRYRINAGGIIFEDGQQVSQDITLYLNATSGSDVNDGATSAKAVKTIARLLELTPKTFSGTVKWNLTGTIDSTTEPTTPVICISGGGKRGAIGFKLYIEGGTYGCTIARAIQIYETNVAISDCTITKKVILQGCTASIADCKFSDSGRVAAKYGSRVSVEGCAFNNCSLCITSSGASVVAAHQMYGTGNSQGFSVVEANEGGGGMILVSDSTEFSATTRFKPQSMTGAARGVAFEDGVIVT